MMMMMMTNMAYRKIANLCDYMLNYANISDDNNHEQL